MLVLSRGPEEAIVIGGTVEVKVLDVRGDRVRLGIVAPASVSIHRKEVYLSIQRENWAASTAVAAGLAGAVGLLGRTAKGSGEGGARGRVAETGVPAGPAGEGGGAREGEPRRAVRRRGKVIG